MAKMTTQEREMKKCIQEGVIKAKLADARYYASSENLLNEGPLNGLQMELAHESFIDWAYVHEKTEKVIRAMKDIQACGKDIREAQRILGRL